MASTSTTTSTRPPVTHTVEVGKADYTFVPDIVLAEIGDVITWKFYPRNHSVVRADYEFPCIPYELVNSRPGFWSGWKPVDTILDEPPMYSVVVNDTEPIFVYCSSPEACDEYGMVGVVNPNATTSLDTFRTNAKNAGYVLQPGDKWPTEGPDPNAEEEEEGQNQNHYDNTSTASPTSSIAPTITVTTTPTVTGSSDSSSLPSSQGSNGLSPGAIAGIAIGAAAVALIAAIAIYMCGRRSRRDPASSDGSWFLGNKGSINRNRSLTNSGAATPATLPPTYNQHGMPIMTQAHTGNKAFPDGLGVNANVVEQYGGTPAQMNPYYTQQNLPPHLLDPAAFNMNHTPGYMAATNQVLHPNPQPSVSPQGQYYRSEIYSGTPAPRPSFPPPETQHFTNSDVITSESHRNSAMTNANGAATATSTDSGVASPDVIHEMTAVKSQVGSINHGHVQAPVPMRDSGGLETRMQPWSLKKIDDAA